VIILVDAYNAEALPKISESLKKIKKIKNKFGI
jgi:hypothetical protein